MGLWSSYIAWVDRDLDENLPSVQNCLSTLVPILPYALALPVMMWWEPSGAIRTMLHIALPISSALLLAIWIWRLMTALFRQPGKWSSRQRIDAQITIRVIGRPL